MNILFNTTLNINGSDTIYRVFFENEIYKFEPEDPTGLFLGLRRHEDEWHTENSIVEEIKNAATTALDKYLLSQH